MERIASFCVDHTKLQPGMYLSRQDGANGEILTWDIRMKQPNKGSYLSPAAAHTLEHLFATYARNSKYSSGVVYVGPMGCLTGFYLLTTGLTPAEARLLLPSRAEFVGLWRYLQRRCAGLGRVEDTASRIARGASRATGQREAAERVLLCLEVLAERGLIDLEIGPQGVAVSLRQVERKVDLEASPILGRLRQAIRGGSAEA